MPTEDSLSDDRPEHVGWERDAQDDAEEAERIAGGPALETPQAMRRSLPLGRFLILLVGVCIAVGLLLYFIFNR